MWWTGHWQVRCRQTESMYSHSGLLTHWTIFTFYRPVLISQVKHHLHIYHLSLTMFRKVTYHRDRKKLINWRETMTMTSMNQNMRKLKNNQRLLLNRLRQILRIIHRFRINLDQELVLKILNQNRQLKCNQVNRREMQIQVVRMRIRKKKLKGKRNRKTRNLRKNYRKNRKS
jgi:hypothetical protein